MQKKSFHGGVHPLHGQHEGKLATQTVPVREFVSDTVCIPMNMHLGAPSAPCVKKGDLVKLGQRIGDPVGGLGVAVHASVSGEVMSVGYTQQLANAPSMCVTIKNDFKDEWVEGLTGLGNVETVDPDKIVPAIREAGICGMGGACFPTHVKLTIPEGKSCDTIIINGAECETFLTADHRLMLETPLRVVDGLRAVMRALRVPRGVIAIEDNKMDAVEAMRKAAQGREGVEVMVLRTKYPQGGEKTLIKAVTGREVPSGKLPVDAHVVVLNVATTAAIADAVIDGTPLISRVTTVTGCVRKPANLKLRIGTIFLDAVGECDGYSEEPGKIIAGGTMTGICAPDDSVSMTKATNGIVVLNEKQAASVAESPCLRCGRCVDACPVGLNPYHLKNLCDRNDLEGLKANHVMDCMLCSTCSYACPAKRWLAASFKNAKALIAAAARRA